MKNPKNFEIILGTYEEFVVGYRAVIKSEGEPELTLNFACHSHNSSVRCITHSEHYLGSGGADDRIVIFDLKSRKEHCTLTHHNGTVNCIKFTQGHTHLISGGSDGQLAITRVGNWQLEKVWDKAHKGESIIDIAIHPSNKLVLTLGADCTLRTWNLVKGRPAYVINLNSKSKDPKSLQYINWAPGGVKFVMCGGLHTDIWSIETGGILEAIEHKNRVSYSLFYNDDTLVVGFENGSLSLVDLNDKQSTEIKAHTGRLKSIDIYKRYLVTCSSNGEVKLWNKDLQEVAKCNTGCRNTCIALIAPTWIKKEEKDEDDVEESVLVNDPLEKGNNTIIPKTRKHSDVSDAKHVPTVIVEGGSPKRKKKKKKLEGIQSFEEVNVNDINEVIVKEKIKRKNKKKVRNLEEANEDVTHKKKKKKTKEKL